MASVRGTENLRSLEARGSRSRGGRQTHTVGRARELSELGSWIRERRMIVLEGPAGIGKTHLARAVLSELSADGVSVVEILGGSASPEVPLGPFVHVVPAVVGDVPLAGLIASTLDTFRRQSELGELAVLADDIDLFDEASAVLMAHLMRAGHCAVIATCRNPGALAAPLTSLVAERWVELYQVEPLGARHVAQLSAALLGGELEPAAGLMVHKVTGGNPLWVTELMRAAKARQAVVPGPGGLELEESAAVGGLDSLLLLRLSHLSEDERLAIELLAVAGALPLNFLEHLAGNKVTSTLASRGLITAPLTLGEPNVQLAHPLYRHCVLARLQPLEIRGRLRQLITAAQSELDATGANLVRLALWHAELGEHFEPARLSVAAKELHWGLLELVRRRLAGEEGDGTSESGWALGLASAEARAVATYRLAAAAWAEERTFANGLALARSLATFRPELAAEMVSVLEALRELARTDEDRAWLAMYEALWLFWTMGDRQGALEGLKKAQNSLGQPWEIVVRATAAGLGVQLGDVADSMEILERLELDESIPPPVRLTVDSPLAAGLNLSGRLDEGIERARSSVEIGLQLGGDSTVATMELLISQYWGLVCRGDYQETVEGARAIGELLAQTEDNEVRALFVGIEARAMLFQGRPAGAERRVNDALRWHGSLSMFGFRPLLHTTRALSLAWSGRCEEAKSECAEARRWHQPPRPFDADLDIAEVLVLAGEGRLSQAVSKAMSAFHDSARRGIWYYAFVAAYVLMRLQPTQEHLDLLEACAQRVDVRVARLAPLHGRALLEDDVNGLAEAAEQATDMGELLLAVEMLQASLVRLSSKQSRTTHDRLIARLDLLRDRCEGARSPLVRIAQAAPTLTSREQEIASLAAKGWSSPAIADELTVSVRTVESHLYRAFAKLGVRSREELAATLDKQSE